jgi:iron(III) transport system substrate-binding protein
MKKRWIKLGALVVVASMVGLFAVDCGAKQPQKQDKSLVIYTNSGNNGRAEWLTEKAAQKGYKLNVVTLGGGDLANRLVAEKNNQIADLVYGLNAVEYEKLIKQKLLLKYKPSWAKEVDVSLGSKSGYYYPIVVQPLLLAYNKQSYNEQTAPKDWTDLAKPEFKNKHTILNLGGGTAKTIIASILVRYQDRKGEYGISKKGWDVIKNYIQSGHLEVQGEDYYSAMIKGERPLLMVWGSGLLQNEQTRGVKFGIMTPQIGVPFVVEQVAIFAKSKKANVAKEFVNWFGSAEFQAEWSAKFGTTPVQPAALAKAAPEVKELMAAVKPQKINWTFVADNIDKWMEKIQLEYVK